MRILYMVHTIKLRSRTRRVCPWHYSTNPDSRRPSQTARMNRHSDHAGSSLPESATSGGSFRRGAERDAVRIGGIQTRSVRFVCLSCTISPHSLDSPSRGDRRAQPLEIRCFRARTSKPNATLFLLFIAADANPPEPFETRI